MRSPRLLPTTGISNRREFLKKSLAGTLLLASAAFLARCSRRQETSRPAGLLILNGEEFKTLAAFSAAVLPGLGPSVPPVTAVPHRIDREISQWTPKNQSQVKSLLALIENGTRYFFFSWRPFSELALRERQDYLHEWENSRLAFRRQAFQALRMMAFFYFYSQDETWKAIGYDGPWVKPLSH